METLYKNVIRSLPCIDARVLVKQELCKKYNIIDSHIVPEWVECEVDTIMSELKGTEPWYNGVFR